VIVGHSERRNVYHEGDALVARRLSMALDSGLTPVLCIGEDLRVREAGHVARFLADQIKAAASPSLERGEVVIAYEPIWAIGTGVVATPEQAQEAISFVRALVRDRSPEAAEQVRVLYGGSVTPDNAREFFAQPDIDGALVGGASLDAAGFAAIVACAAELRG